MGTDPAPAFEILHHHIRVGELDHHVAPNGAQRIAGGSAVSDGASVVERVVEPHDFDAAGGCEGGGGGLTHASGGPGDGHANHDRYRCRSAASKGPTAPTTFMVVRISPATFCTSSSVTSSIRPMRSSTER